MSFLDTVRRAKTYLEEQGRVSVRALKREFELDDNTLDELIEELVDIQRIAVRDGRALAWAGKVPPAPTEPPARERDPRDYTPKHLADKILQSKSALEGERKQVTVLFADVKGSMELAEQVDPEEWHSILDRFFQILASGVHRFEGTVNQYTGDGIMALFGAPIAHEDHAQRGCYAALSIKERLRPLQEELRVSRGLEFQIRIGLNSGEVVVGKIGDDLRMDYTAQGHTVGLAARVERFAEPGKVYLTEYTAGLVEGFFRLRHLGRFSLRGVSEPVQVCELTGVGPLRTHLEVAARRGLVRFVGRRTEMEQLRQVWEAARAGRGQIAGCVGEAGVGKSRLVYEFKASLGEGCRMLEAFSVSHGKANPYLPLLDLLRRYFGIVLADDEDQRREKITAKVLALDQTLEETLPYLFTLLGVADGAASLAQMDPQILRQRTLEAIKRVLLRETLDQPCVVIFEDLQWIDTETQAFLDLLSESTAMARLLLLVNYRPEYRHGWGNKTYYTQLRLDPLGREEARELLEALLGEGESRERESLERLVLEKTEGNPFFIDEMVQTLAEEGVLSGGRGRYRVEKPPGELHIPTTVQGVLAARIDRLPEEEKALLQTLSVIGLELPFGLLLKVAHAEEGALRRLLSRLQAAEFIYEQPAFPEPEYTFKHALTQQVAYASLLVERRKRLHERTARAIEALYGDALKEHYRDLAHHYGRTDNTPKAIEYLCLAGEQAARRSSYAEAIDQLNRGMELIATLPETRERSRQELLLQTTLGRGLVVTRGFTDTEAEQAFARARDLAERVGDASQLFQAVQGLFQINLVRSEHQTAPKLAGQLLRLGQGTRDPAQLLLAHHCMGVASYWRGEYHTAREHLEEVIRRYDPRQYRAHEHLWVSQNPCVSALGYLGRALLSLGYPDQALTKSREGLVLAHELSHPFSEATALLGVSRAHMVRGEFQACLDTAEALITVGSEHGFPYWVGIGTFMKAMALANQGRLEEGIAGMRAIREALRATGAVMGSASMLTNLAEAHGRAGQVKEGLELMAETSAFIARTGEREVAAEVHRVRSELLLVRSRPDQAAAEAGFRKGLEIARGQSAKFLELRVATSLARLWHRQGRQREAHQLLAPLCQWFTEGFDTRDLKEAKHLLGELA